MFQNKNSGLKLGLWKGKTSPSQSQPKGFDFENKRMLLIPILQKQKSLISI